MRRYKEIKATRNSYYPSLHEFKQWLLNVQKSILDFLTNQELFMACFWSNWKNQSLPTVSLAALLIEVHYQRIS